MENLTLCSSSDPAPGDVVLLTVTDESNQPVEDLSVTLVKDNDLVEPAGDANGQTSFAILKATSPFEVQAACTIPPVTLRSKTTASMAGYRATETGINWATPSMPSRTIARVGRHGRRH